MGLRQVRFEKEAIKGRRGNRSAQTWKRRARPRAAVPTAARAPG